MLAVVMSIARTKGRAVTLPGSRDTFSYGGPVTPERSDVPVPGHHDSIVAADDTDEPGPPPSGLSRRRLRIDPARQMPLVVFGWVQIVLALWWVGEFPGLLSVDSIHYVGHVTNGPWIAEHSVLYDSIILVSVHLTDNIWLVTLLQTTVAAAALAYVASSLRLVGVPQWGAAVPALILPLLPSFGAFVTTLWKDVPFALCEILISATVVRIVSRRRDGAHKRTTRWLLLALGGEFLGLVLFRNDGFVVLTVALVILVLTVRGLRLKILGLGVGAILAMLFAQTVVYPAAGIKPAPSSLSYGLFYADIAIAYAQAPHTFTAADKALMKQAAPLSVWRAADTCYTSDTLFKNAKFDRVAAGNERGALLRLWLRAAERTPVTILSARLCRGSVAWTVSAPPLSKTHYGEVTVQVPDSLYGDAHLVPAKIAHNLLSHPLNSTLGTFTRWLRSTSKHPGFQPFIWRAGTWCYLFYLALLIAARRLRRRDVLAIAAVILGHQLTISLLNPAQLFRYMAGAMFIGMLFLPIALARKPQPAGDPAVRSNIPDDVETVNNPPAVPTRTSCSSAAAYDDDLAGFRQGV